MKILNLFKAQKISNPEPGIAAAKKTTTSFMYPEGGWVPMGHDANGSYVVLSLKTGRLVTLRAQDLKLEKLQVWLGLEVRNSSTVYDNELKREITDPSTVTAAIAEECDQLGLLDFAKVRGPGLYRDHGDLVVNLGDQVARASGTTVTLDRQPDGTTYQGGPSLGFGMETPCATADDVQRVLNVLDGFGFKGQGDQLVVAGWCVASFYGAALPHRPILAISAERGSGKTTLIEFLGAILGPQVIRRDGVPTVAQVLYDLENRSAALIVDEFEGRGSKKAAVENFTELLRTSFSASSTSRLSRVIGGKARYFNAPAGVLVAGISLPAFNTATETRTVRVMLDPLPEASRACYEPLLDAAREAETVELGARIRRLLVSRWSVMRDTMEAARRMLIAIGHEARIADKFTPLVAGYVALAHDRVPSAEQLRRLIAQLGLDVTATAVVERDAEACLNVLLSRKVAIFRMVNCEKEKVHLTIRDVLTHVVHGDAEVREMLSKQLEEFGIRPLWDRSSASWKLAVCSSEHHEGMRKLMMRTDWALGGWKDVLMRLPGADASIQKVARITQRVVLLDMPREVLEPEDPDYDFPVPEAA